MRFILILILMLALTYQSSGQISYFSTDTSTTYAAKLIDGRDIVNSYCCRVQDGNQIIEYTPYQVKEYGFADGRIYVAKDININDSVQRFFLERLVNGKTTLYYYKGTFTKLFFTEKDSLLTVLPKSNEFRNDYKDKLRLLNKDYNNNSNSYKLVKYNKESLTKFFNGYNLCKDQSYPFLKVGLFLGEIITTPTIKANNESDILENFNANSVQSLYAGIFSDIPLNQNNFSLLSGLGYYQSTYSCNSKTESIFYDMFIEQTTIKIPLLLRYTLLTTKFKAYANAGITFSKNLKNKGTVYKSEIFDNIVEYELPTSEKLMANNLYGYAYGAGIQYQYNYRHIIFVEVRKNHEFSFSSVSLLGKNSIEFTAGLNF